MTNYNKKLSERIKNLRKRSNLTQDIVAKKLKIKREIISNIENNKRQLSVNEILKFSKLFNISTDSLLNLENEIEINLKNKKKQKNKKAIRINVPQKKIDKIKETLIYIFWQVGGRANIGETVLNKLLYFIDFDYYEKYEEQLLGATYVRNHYGPTPKELIKVIQKMEQDKEITKIENKYFQYPQTKYLALRKPDLTKFKANEMALINDVLNKLGGMNASSISNYVHKDVPWLTTEMGQIIDYESVFYRTPEYSVRNYDE
ncbi:MAG: DUF4065 domain-containing protein [Candidatus Marinimicrobia bacterium]|nr:DUF4065 domain-containing protein [Candidatus Neomarinimicrobiota bacterium]